MHLIFAICSAAVFCICVWGMWRSGSLLRQIIALNIMASAVFLLLGSAAWHSGHSDPVPQAMVITGIVIAVAITAFAIGLLRQIDLLSGERDLPEQREKP